MLGFVDNAAAFQNHPHRLRRRPYSARPENSVARVTEAWHDIPMLVKFFVECGRGDLYIRMVLEHRFHPRVPPAGKRT